MKPILLKITSGPSVSFNARTDAKSYKNNNWHYHPEIELIHVVKGEGTLFAGDGMHYFKNGDLVLIGSMLPHYWKFDDLYTLAEKPLKSYIELTQFRDDFWGKNFLTLPENQKIASLLERAQKGMVMKGPKASAVKNLLKDLTTATETRRIILLLEILYELAEFKKCQYIASDYSNVTSEGQSDRINAVYNHTLRNFKEKINIKTLADITNMTPNSFCRYFKSCTRKSYSQFVMELRIGHACKLLSEGRKSIKEVCYESGFNSFTLFNRQFKKSKGLPPNEYKKSMQLE
ncbi:AraC family transcriptional regulator [Chitinophagaceae bacterium 26-R-25]|nr:AraC family transcriptional regulator [Chitinophagaceae bacterium 26-R-25]